MDASSLTFEEFFDHFIACYQQGEYEQALRLVESEGPRYPENGAQVLAWQSAMLARLERVDEAIGALETAEQRGFWYLGQALRHDSDFASLQNHPGFSALVERLEARRLACVPLLKPARQVIEPPGPGPHPVCVVLHGNQANIGMTVPYWRGVVGQGWALAALQSAQAGWASGTYVWTDVDRSLAEVRGQLAELAGQPTLAPQALIAGGFSMGARIAVRMALDPTFQLRGVIAHEAWFNEAAMAELAQVASRAEPTGARVALIAGRENSEYANMAQQVHDLLSGRGFACQVIYASNPQHGYPAEFARLLEQAIDWIG